MNRKGAEYPKKVMIVAVAALITAAVLLPIAAHISDNVSLKSAVQMIAGFFNLPTSVLNLII